VAVEAARPAEAGDLARLELLARQARDELRPGRGGSIFLASAAGRGRPALSEAMADPDRGVWVGTIDEVVVGYAAAHDEQLADGSRLGVIDDLFVEPGARGVGVGEALMDRVLGWCASRGCAGVDAMALPGSRATKNFFEESGFTARLLVMHRRLGDARPT
jgi:GNAT superfamily N-acetyltransferase